jgi:hypothetical protein
MKERVNIITSVAAGLFLVALITGCKKENNDKDKARVFSASGDITSTLTAFRNLLGNLNSTTGVTTGRREINWDGVPDSLDGKKLRNDFFNRTDANAPVSLQRGAIYAGDDNAMVSKSSFSEIDPNASAEFAAFSGNKTFAVVNATLWPVTFKVAGQTTDATVNAFGAVFSDVDKTNSTFIEFFNGQTSLGRFYAPAHDNTSSFSFLAVYFPNTKVTQVQVGHEGMLIDGQKDVSNGGDKDLVVLDDFIYSEPLVK